MRKKDNIELVDEKGNPLNADSIKEMTYHFKQKKKAWKKANRKAAWPLRIITVVLILGIAGTGLTLLKKSQDNAANVDEDLQVIPITLTEVTRGNMMTTYKGNGDVIPASSVDVYPETASGKITRINVEIGDQVVKNQVLLYIDPSRPGQNYAASPVKAPVGGTVTSLSVELGSQVSMQMPIATIGNLSKLEVVTYIPEKYVSFISPGQQTRISLISWEDDFVLGKIKEISPVVDPTSRTMKVTMDLAAQDQRIKAGMFVRISMVTQEFKNVLTIPAQAMVERFDDQFVFVLKGDTVERRDIVSGLTVNGTTRIDDGLSMGEQIVLKGNNLLEDGTAVKVVEDQ